MPLVDTLLGSGPGERLVIVGTVVLYVYLGVRRPADARASLERGGRMLLSLGTLILAALFLAAALGSLVPAATIAGYVGATAGLKGVVLAGLIGGVLPGGPYAVYPIVSGVAGSGATTASLLAMLTGYGAIELQRVSYGLVFFDPEVVAGRVVAGVVVTLAVAVVLWAVLP